MSKQSMLEVIESVKVNADYDMTAGEVAELMKESNEFDKISKAFMYGYAMGQKAQAAGK